MDHVNSHPATWTSARTAYGIDFSNNYAVITRAIFSKGRFKYETIYEGFVKKELSIWRKTIGNIQESVQSGKAWTSAAIPAHNAFAKHLKTRLTSPSKARRVFPGLLDIDLPFPLEKCQVVYFPEKDRHEGSRALAAGARLTEIQQRLEELENTGLPLTLLDHEAIALWSFLKPPSKNDETHIILNISNDHTLLVFGTATQFKGNVALRAGWENWADNSGNISPDYLVKIKRVLRSGLNDVQLPIKSIMLCGTALTQSQPIEPLISILKEELHATPHITKNPSRSLSHALATRALKNNSLPVNLRQGSLLHTELHRRKQKILNRCAILCFLTGISLGTFSWAWSYVIKREKKELQQQLTAHAMEISGLPHVDKGMELLQARRAISQQEKKRTPFSLLLTPSLSEHLDKILSWGKQDDFIFNHLRLSHDTLEISGSAVDWDICEKLKNKIASLGYDLKLTRQNADAQERIPFTLKNSENPAS